MNGNEMYIGLVQKGQFKLLVPERIGGLLNLTTIQVQAAQTPESAELNLEKYESSAIAVQGHLSGDLIFSSEVVDTAGPIVTALVRKVFGE